GQIAINPHLFSKLPYQPLKDLAPVSLIGTSPLYLVAHPSVPVNNLKELVALAKKEPGKLNYGSSGIGSIHHLATEALKAGFGIDAVGSTPADYAALNKTEYEKYGKLVKATGAKVD